MTLFLWVLNDLAVTISIKEIELQDDQKDKKYPIASGQTKGSETNGFNQILILDMICMQSTDTGFQTFIMVGFKLYS